MIQNTELAKKTYIVIKHFYIIITMNNDYLVFPQLKKDKTHF